MMKEYRERVKRAAESRSGEPLYNGSVEHAAILAESLFSSAQASVKILSGELNARVYGRSEVVEQANLFLADPKHKAEILVEHPDSLDWENHPFLRAILDNDNVVVKSVPMEIQKLYEFHMFIADGDCYRFERDKESPSAIAVFGDKIGAENLLRAFEKLWAHGDEVHRNNLQ